MIKFSNKEKKRLNDKFKNIPIFIDAITRQIVDPPNNPGMSRKLYLDILRFEEILDRYAERR